MSKEEYDRICNLRITILELKSLIKSEFETLEYEEFEKRFKKLVEKLDELMKS